MNDPEIQQIADRVILALQNLAPGDPGFWANLPSFTPFAALIAASVAAWVGWRNLKQQQKALRVSVASDARNLRQKREADARSEWWRRTQWALEASLSENQTLYDYGIGMLTLLVESNLASDQDKAMLDTVWQGTDTEMDDGSIAQLVSDLSALENVPEEDGGLSEGEKASVDSFIEIAPTSQTPSVASPGSPLPPAPVSSASYNVVTSRKLRRKSESRSPVDEASTTRENESSKEE